MRGKKTMKKILALLCAISLLTVQFVAFSAFAEAPPSPSVESVEETSLEETIEDDALNFVLPEDGAVLAKVNGVEILGSEVNRLFNNIASEYAMYGLDFNDSSLSEEILQLAYNSVIQKQVMLQNAAKLGIVAPSGDALESLKASVQEKHQDAVNAWVEELTPENATDIEKEAIQKKSTR